MPTDPNFLPDASQNSAPAQSSTIADKLRALVAGVIADPLNRKGWQDAVAQAPQSIASARAVGDKIVSYLPVPQSIRDHVSDIADLAQDFANSALSNDPMDTMTAQAASIGRGVRQGVTGFNEGLGSYLTAPADAIASVADTVGNTVGGWFGSPPINLPKPSDMYNALFVDPAGPAVTRGQKLMRAGGNAVGQSVPTVMGGLGLATSGIRSGVSLADQAAGGLLDSVEAPAAANAAPTAATVAPVTDAAAPASSISGVFQKYMPVSSFAARQIGRAVPTAVKSLPGNIIDAVSPANLQSQAQNFANGLNPSNIVNAFNPANLQGATDSTLDFMAQNPALVAKAKAVQAFHTGTKNERALLNQQNQPPQQSPDAAPAY